MEQLSRAICCRPLHIGAAMRCARIASPGSIRATLASRFWTLNLQWTVRSRVSLWYLWKCRLQERADPALHFRNVGQWAAERATQSSDGEWIGFLQQVLLARFATLTPTLHVRMPDPVARRHFRQGTIPARSLPRRSAFFDCCASRGLRLGFSGLRALLQLFELAFERRDSFIMFFIRLSLRHRVNSGPPAEANGL